MFHQHILLTNTGVGCAQRRQSVDTISIFVYTAYRLSSVAVVIIYEQYTLCFCVSRVQSHSIYVRVVVDCKCLPSYHDESTRTRQISQVKHRRARLVLGSETAWEPRVW